MEPTIYHIDNYLNLRRHSEAEPVAEIIKFPKDKVHWKNYYEQKQAENNGAIEAVKVNCEIERAAEFRPKGTRIPLSFLTTDPSQLNHENQYLGY